MNKIPSRTKQAINLDISLHNETKFAQHVSVFMPDQAFVARILRAFLALDIITKCCNQSTLELGIHLLDRHPMRHINRMLRKKNQITNVISVNYELPEMFDTCMGDMFFCPNYIHQEALILKRSLDFHWAHLLVHGLLHILGQDHIERHERQVMEHCEAVALKRIGYTQAPYG